MYNLHPGKQDKYIYDDIVKMHFAKMYEIYKENKNKSLRANFCILVDLL